jgi:uncharacterized protein YjbI with pentapeptide repeats
MDLNYYTDILINFHPSHNQILNNLQRHNIDISNNNLISHPDYPDLQILDLSNIELPHERGFFQQIECKCLISIKMPEKDYSIYNFSGIKLLAVEFTRRSVLPQDQSLFQNVHNNSIAYVKLPETDLRNFSFNDVNIVGTHFPERSILPSDINLFQNIRDKNLTDAYLPTGDYSDYDLTDVCILGTHFTQNSKLPHVYNIEKCPLVISSSLLSPYQHVILSKKLHKDI